MSLWRNAQTVRQLPRSRQRLQRQKLRAARPAAKPAGGSAGAVQITASVPGKVFKVEASAGQSVKAGDTIVILEAMKMEIPVVAPQDGTIAGIDVAVGDTVESGDALASMD